MHLIPDHDRCFIKDLLDALEVLSCHIVCSQMNRVGLQVPLGVDGSDLDRLACCSVLSRQVVVSDFQVLALIILDIYKADSFGILD